MNNSQNRAIHVAFGLSDVSGQYSKYVATAIASILLHTQETIVIHILCDNSISDENIDKINQTVECYGAKIVYHRIELPTYFQTLDSIKNITIGTLFRLFIPEVCENIDRVIYLDADTLIQCDISRMLQYDLNDSYAGVVLDVYKTRRDYINTKLYKKLGVNKDIYFNAGVMVFNCVLIRKEMNLVDKGLEILNVMPFLPFADQDVLNILFKGKIVLLDNMYNYQIDLIASDSPQDALDKKGILHFSGYLKPWNCANDQVIRYYYAVMARTEYVNTIEDMNNMMSTISYNFHMKYDLKHALMDRSEPSNKIIKILCFFSLIFNGKLYKNVLRSLWLIRERVKLNHIYPFKI